MKKAILLLAALLLVLGAALPLAGYWMAGQLLGAAASGPAGSAPASSAPAPEPGGLAGLTGSGPEDTQVLLQDQDSGQTFTLSMKDYILGAVASEMPVSWPDEALKAQAVACHSYILYCRDHRSDEDDPWLTVDPARGRDASPTPSCGAIGAPPMRPTMPGCRRCWSRS